MSAIGQYVLNGLMQGTIYGLVAMGFTIFFGVMNVIKFSHGDVMTFGAFGALVAATAAAAAGLPVGVQILAAVSTAVGLAALLGAGISRLLILPLRTAPPLNLLLMTMMVGTVIREAIRLFFPNGTNSQRFPALLPSGGDRRRRLRPLRRADPDGGRAPDHRRRPPHHQPHPLRARDAGGGGGSGDRPDDGRQLLPCRPPDLRPRFGDGGLRGVISGLYYSEINYGMGLLIAVIGFSAAIVGGLGNLWGDPRGYLFAGLQTVVVATLPTFSEYKNVVAFVAVIALITWRPTGLLAERASERV